MPVDPKRVQIVFRAAVEELDSTARAEILERECGTDADLRRRVEALLRANDEPDSYVDQPAVAPVNGTVDFAPCRENPGTMIGPFKLLQLLGEGGMGEVWMAEQIQPVQRKVALKIMKPGMDSRPVLARFEAERQALALMDHPNIAKVLDGGATATGRPYFVMELVKGKSITKYCDEHRLTPKQRLELFVPVCQAIQHAHQKGIIHRDVKPSNVLVAPYDGKPVVKVIDFGVVKATGQRLTEQTLFTEFGAVVGTLEYMSPEQAELNNQDIDTRSDIYSLGVLLYELLTGTPPLQRQRLKQAAFDEVLRLIREEDPPKPSTRLSESKDSLPSISAQRQMEPARLTKLVRGELDWIVMKALDKDRNRRYETANGFARDIERYLADEAVQACPLSARYRLRKFVQRNKRVVSAASLLILSLLAGIAGTSWGMLRAVKAQEAEKEQRERAEINERRALDAARAERAAKETALAREEESKAVLSFVESKVYAAARPEGQAGGLGKSVTLRKALDAALPFIEKSFEKRPLIEARLRLSMGKSYGYLGEFRIAAEQCARAHEIYKKLLGPDDAATLASNNELSYNLDRLGRYDEALVLFEEAFAREKSKFGPHHVRTLGAMSNLANGYDQVKRYPDALKLREEALALMRAHLPPDDPFILNVKHNLAKSYEQLGRRDEALRLREETLARWKAKHGSKHPDTLEGMASLAKSLALLNRHEQALPLFEEALALQREQIGSDHPSTLLTMTSLAGTYHALGRRNDALRILEEALALGKAKHGADDLATLKSMTALARYHALMGRYDQAIALHQEALAILKSKFGLDHTHTFECMSNLSHVYHELNDHDKALRLREEILALSKAKFGADNLDTVTSRANLANSYAAVGRHEDALKLNEETVALLKAKLSLDHRSTLTAMFNVSSTYGRLGRYQEAAKLREEILARMKVALGPDDPTTLYCMNGLACHYFSLGRFEDALQLHQQTLARMRAKLRPGHPSTLDSMSNLAQTLAVLGRTAEALALHKEAVRHAAAHLPSNHPSALDATNELAWFLATTTDAKLRDPAEAVRVAAKVVELSPKITSYRSTRGVCRYRNRQFQAAIADLEEASRHRKPDESNRAYDGYFLAMAHWQLGNKPMARDWFDKAVQWQARASREDAQLRRFQAEAAELLGIEIKPKP